MSTKQLFEVEDPGSTRGTSIWPQVSKQINKIRETEAFWGQWIAVLETTGMSSQTASSRRQSIAKRLESMDEDAWEAVNRTVSAPDAEERVVRTYVKYTPDSVSVVRGVDEDDDEGEDEDDEDWDE